MFKDVNDLTNEELKQLHGLCHQWCIDNFKVGDEIVALTEYDDDIEDDALLHCYLFRNNEFGDVRGFTDNFEEMMEDFDYYDFTEWSFKNVTDFKNFLDEMKISYKSNIKESLSELLIENVWRNRTNKIFYKFRGTVKLFGK